MDNLPWGAAHDSQAPYNEEREFCPNCGQELIKEDGEWIHQFGRCPADEDEY